MSDVTDASKEKIDDQDREVRIPKHVLVDVLGMLALDERAAIDRKIATDVGNAIRKAISRADHPAGTA